MKFLSRKLKAGREVRRLIRELLSHGRSEAYFHYILKAMNVVRYLPSAQFTLLVGALALSSMLVYTADYFSKVHPQKVATISADIPQPQDPNWEAALYAIQAQNASSSLLASDQNAVGELLNAAQSANVTESVGRTLLINLSDAKSPGLGDDIPTQNEI